MRFKPSYQRQKCFVSLHFGDDDIENSSVGDDDGDDVLLQSSEGENPRDHSPRLPGSFKACYKARMHRDDWKSLINTMI